MRKLLPIFLLFNFCVMIQAQNTKMYHIDFISKETSSFMKQYQDCMTNNDENCSSYLKKMIDNAKKTKECLACTELEVARKYSLEYKLDTAQLYIESAERNSKKLDEKLQNELLKELYNLKASMFSNLGKYDLAIEYFNKSREVAEKIGDHIHPILIYVNIGVIYHKLRDPQKAISYQKLALKELDKQGITKRRALILSNIASFYTDVNKRDSVIYWSNLTIKQAIADNDIRSVVAGYYLKATGFMDENNDSAEFYIDKAIKLGEENQLDYQLATSYNVKGNLLGYQNNYSEAKKYLEKSIHLYKEMSAIPNLEFPLENLGKIAFLNKDYKTSAEAYDQLISLKDSLRTEENRLIIEELNTKYETEKKEKLIAEQDLKIQKQTTNFWIAILGGLLLASILGGIYYTNRKSNQNKLIQLQSEKENAILNSFIQGEERERNRISHELHDGVAAMLGAAKMSIESIPHLPPDKQNEQLVRIKTILENTHADVRHIAHNLLPTVLEKEGLIKATEHFATELNASKLIQISVVDHDSNANELKPQLQLMLFRVIQELINNTIKHSQAKIAQIEFSRNDNGLQIEVSDDGIGFDGDVNDGNQGLYSISQRLKSIGGNFKFIRKSDRGMKAVAELKVD